MTPYRDLLAEGLLLRRPRYLAISTPYVGDRARVEMTDGFLALITEALREEGTSARRFYVEHLLPRLLLSGDPELVADTLITWTLDVIDDVVSWVPSRTRQEAVMWLAGFFAAHVGDLEAARQATSARACA